MGAELMIPTVEEIAELMGLSPAVVRKLLDMAPSRLEALTADIRAGLTAGDHNAVAISAHAAKGVCSNLRLKPFVDIVFDIEQNAKNQCPATDSLGLCDRLDACTGELRRMLSGGSVA
jgi:HPt (histidine-containing phosphotransfer) domain-containing protein